MLKACWDNVDQEAAQNFLNEMDRKLAGGYDLETHDQWKVAVNNTSFYFRAFWSKIRISHAFKQGNA